MEISPALLPDKCFYSKQIDFDGIPIRAASVVVDRALLEAKKRLRMMLRNLPSVVDNLKAAGVEFHIIGRNQQTSDLPEHRHLKGRPFDGFVDVDARTRGLGGLFASCGEENLLRLKKDRYLGRDICVHEFAHTIKMHGFDAELCDKVVEQYKRSTKAGLWPGCYAATNDDEFFAELTMWYFGTRGDYGEINPSPEPGASWLKNYDSEAFALLDDIFSGRVKVVSYDNRRLSMLLPEQENQLESKNAHTKTRICFDNRTSRCMNLYWLDYQGERKQYGVVEAHGKFALQTFATHPWLLADQADRGVAIFVAQEYPGIAILGEDAVVRED